MKEENKRLQEKNNLISIQACKCHEDKKALRIENTNLKIKLLMKKPK